MSMHVRSSVALRSAVRDALRFAACAGLTWFASSSPASAQAGQLDPSFGAGGLFTTNLQIPDNNVNNLIALQNDGKIVVAGGMNNLAAILRLDANGVPDAGFGTAGIVTSNFTLVHGPTIVGLVILSDGRILAAASTVDVNPGPKLGRFNPDGTVDTSFGGLGFADIPLPSAAAMVQQPDGQVLIAGGPGVLAPQPGAITRMTTDGQVDSTFGNAGVAILLSPSVTAMALQADGRILIASGGPTPSMLPDAPSAGSIARYKPNGSVDRSFGIAGQAACVASASAICVQPDGKIVVAGSLTGQLHAAGNFTGFGLVRYNADGSLDATFGVHGGLTTVFAPTGPLGSAWSLALEPNGEIIAAGQAGQRQPLDYHSPSSFALARYGPSGRLDPTFGANGTTTTAFGTNTAWISAAILQPDGRLVVAGNSGTNTQQGFLDNFVVARYFTH